MKTSTLTMGSTSHAGRGTLSKYFEPANAFDVGVRGRQDGASERQEIDEAFLATRPNRRAPALPRASIDSRSAAALPRRMRACPGRSAPGLSRASAEQASRYVAQPTRATTAALSGGRNRPVVADRASPAGHGRHHGAAQEHHVPDRRQAPARAASPCANAIAGALAVSRHPGRQGCAVSCSGFVQPSGGP